MRSSTRRRHVARTAVFCGLALALAALPLGGCSTTTASNDTQTASEGAGTAADAAAGGEAVSVIDATDAFSDRDLSAAYADHVVSVTLADAGSSADGDGVTIDGSVVTITEEGTYVLAGTLTAGQVVVDAPDDAKVQVVLAGASITNPSGAAILVENADKAFLTLAEGTENAVSSTGGLGTTEDSNVDGAVFSRDDLTINGSGSLAVSSTNHGIVCKDDLVLASATVAITAEGTAIQAKDSVAVASGTWSLDAGSDGIHAENDEDATEGWVYVAGGTIDVTAGDDGIWAGAQAQVDGGTISLDVADDAVHAEYELAVNGGAIDATSCYEGLEGSKVYVAGGDTTIVSTDDGVNAAGEPDATDASTDDDIATRQQPGFQDMGDMMADDTALLSISGGTLTITASGDGLDSNGDLEVSGGTVCVSGPESGGNGSIDYGEGCSATITGGTVLCAGSSGMAEGFGTGSTQPSALVSLSGSAGDTIAVTDASGTVLASMEAQTSYQCVVASAPGMEVGGTYAVSNGTDSVEVTFDSVTYSDVTGAMGMQGGMGQAPEGMGAQSGQTPPGGSWGERRL